MGLSEIYGLPLGVLRSGVSQKQYVDTKKAGSGHSHGREPCQSVGRDKHLASKTEMVKCGKSQLWIAGLRGKTNKKPIGTAWYYILCLLCLNFRTA